MWLRRLKTLRRLSRGFGLVEVSEMVVTWSEFPSTIQMLRIENPSAQSSSSSQLKQLFSRSGTSPSTQPARQHISRWTQQDLEACRIVVLHHHLELFPYNLQTTDMCVARLVYTRVCVCVYLCLPFYHCLAECVPATASLTVFLPLCLPWCVYLSVSPYVYSSLFDSAMVVTVSGTVRHLDLE